MAEVLRKANAIMAVLRCPADAVFTDVQGRRTGIVDGQIINEIPGAGAGRWRGGSLHAPGRGSYSLSIDATDQGMVDLDVIRTEDESAGITSFKTWLFRPERKMTGTIQAGGEISNLQSGSESIPPSLDTTVDLSGFAGEASDKDQAEGSTSGDKVEAQEELIMEVNTLGGVGNAPISPVQFTLDRPYTITRIRTYPLELRLRPDSGNNSHSGCFRKSIRAVGSHRRAGNGRSSGCLLDGRARGGTAIRRLYSG